VRAEAEETRLALQKAQIEAEAARDSAAREARAAAEEAANRAHQGELARVRSDAQSRMHQELERVRQESDWERQAQARAESTLRAEIAHARAEADARLASEVAEVRAEADRRRDTELAEIRSQLNEAYQSAREDARSVATKTVSAEVARAEIAVAKTVARVAAQAGGQAASATIRAAGSVLRWTAKRGRAAVPVVGDAVKRLPPRVVAVAATILIVAAGVAVVGLPSIARRWTPFASSASRTAGTLMDVAGHAVQTSITSANRAAAATVPARVRTAAPVKPEREPDAVPSGWLAVFSRVPLDLYVSGRRIGRTGDDSQIVLAPGTYRIELVSKEFNYRGEIVLRVRSGQTTSHTVSLPNGLLQVHTDPGAEIWIEGQRAGISPLGPLPVPIGTRDVVVRRPDGGERRQAVEVRYNETAQLSISLETAHPAGNPFPLPPLARIGPLTR
jgi:hypothetical protein